MKGTDVSRDAHPTLVELLRHAQFLRELAAELCANPAHADDLAQEVWLATLRSPPRHGESPRGWLATLARRIASNRRRDEGRRALRESRASAREQELSPDRVLEMEQLRERVVRAVLALDDPFREVLLLRYWEGLEPKAIALRLGLPGATVRTRLARGLERLRTRLDDTEPGGREVWRLALAPLARLTIRETALGSVVLVMKNLAMPLVAFVLIAVAIAVGFRAGSPPTTASADRAPLASGGGIDGDDAPAPVPATQDAPPPREPAKPAALDLRSVVAQHDAIRAEGIVRGVVLGADGKAAADAEVQVEPWLGALPPGLHIVEDRSEIRRLRSDAQGAFECAFASGPVRVTAQSGDTSARRIAFAAPAREAEDCVLVLESTAPRSPLRFITVDGGNAPIAGVQAELFGGVATDRPMLSAVSDARGEGEFVLPDAAAGAPASGMVIARSPDGRTAMKPWPGARATALRLVLDAPGRLHVRFRGLPGERLRGARLALHAFTSLQSYYATEGRSSLHALDGESLEIADLPAGAYGISLDAPLASPHGARLVTRPLVFGTEPLPNSIAMPIAVVRARETTELELEVCAGAALRGEVHSEGRPVQGARVRAVLAPRTSNFPAGFVLHGAQVWRLDGPYENLPSDPLSHRIAVTDEQGRYAITGLVAGEWRVEVAAPGLSFDRRQAVPLREGEAVALTHALVPAGALQVAARDVTYLGVTREGESRPTMLAITDDAFVTFPGLAPARYVVASFSSDDTVAPQTLGVAEIAAGQTTWLDLRASSVAAVIDGRVLSGTRPVPGALVRLGTRLARCDADGAFRLVAGHPLAFGGPFDAELVVHHGGLLAEFTPDATGPVTALSTTLELGELEAELEIVDERGTALASRVELDWTAANGDPSSPTARFRGSSDANGLVRIGPFRPGTLRGSATFADGGTLPIELGVPANERLRIVRPTAATLQVRVRRDAQALAAARVFVFVWTAAEPAPSDDETFMRRGSQQYLRSDETGVATFTLPAGPVLIRADDGGFLSAPGLARREQLLPGRRLEIDLEL